MLRRLSVAQERADISRGSGRGRRKDGNENRVSDYPGIGLDQGEEHNRGRNWDKVLLGRQSPTA